MNVGEGETAAHGAGHAGATPGACTPADGQARRGLEPLPPKDIIVSGSRELIFTNLVPNTEDTCAHTSDCLKGILKASFSNCCQ